MAKEKVRKKKHQSMGTTTTGLGKEVEDILLKEKNIW